VLALVPVLALVALELLPDPLLEEIELMAALVVRQKSFAAGQEMQYIAGALVMYKMKLA
jgi:hypothetical protein